MPGSPIISRRRLLLLLYKGAIPHRGSCGRLLPYLATVMGGCSHLSHTFYGRLLPCLVISFMGGCSHVCSFLLWEAAPILSLFFYGRLLPCLVISFMGGCSHIWSFLLWEAAPILSLFFYGRLLPALAISSVGGCSHTSVRSHRDCESGEAAPRDHYRTSVMGAFCPNPLYDPGIMRSADSI